jgi:hypothetical protein
MRRFLNACGVILGVVAIGVCYTLYLYLIFSVLTGLISVVVALIPAILVLIFLGAHSIE